MRAGLLLTALLLAGCAAGPSAVPAIPPGTPLQVVFFDSATFDANLSKALEQDTPQVVVVAPERFGLNRIPQRLEIWLAEVQSSGGSVSTQPIAVPGMPVSRGIFSAAIDLSFAAVDAVRNYMTYAPVKQYDVLLEYEEGSGIVQRVSFKPRAAAP